MQAPQLVLEEPSSTPWLVVAPAPRAPNLPLDEPTRARLVRLPIVGRPSVLIAAPSRLRVFWTKYRWYRDHGYRREVAREKAWWHAREAPCPLLASAKPE